MRFLFVSNPDAGHLNPLLAVAAQLAAGKQHDVCFASLRHVQVKVEAKGLRFVDVGALSDAEMDLVASCNRATFDAAAPMMQKLTAVARGIVGVYGPKMCGGLFAHLTSCSHNDMPDLIVTDNLTQAGYEAAEMFQIPLAVVPQYPLSQSLLMAGLNHYNMPAHVPLESMMLNTSQHANSITRYVINPLLKRLYCWSARLLCGGQRNAVRKQLGMRPMAAGTGGLLSVQPGVPRTIYILGCSWELNVGRPLPANWHLVGPMGIDYSQPGSFPPQLGPDDSQVQQFLTAAKEADEPVLYVATGTMVILQPFQVTAMATAFQQLAEGHHIRVLWSLKKDTHNLLPAEVQHASTTCKSDSSNSRLLILPWVNQAAVLAHDHVKVFLSHGGLGSTNEGLSAGVPILCMPFAGDQPTIAQQLVDRGLGVQVNPATLTAQKLIVAVLKLLQDGRYAKNPVAVGQRLRSVSGPQEAIDLLVQFAAGHGPAPHPS